MIKTKKLYEEEMIKRSNTMKNKWMRRRISVWWWRKNQR
jgi:hypothetical protein